MEPNSRLSVTYWGTRGSHPRVLTAIDEMRLLRALAHSLSADDKLHQLTSSSDSELEALLTQISLPARFGNHSSCIEIQYRDFRYLIDAGSGIQQWAAEHQRERVTNTFLLLTHNHLDHICGLPFAAPLYCEENEIELWVPSKTFTNLQQIIPQQPNSGSSLFPITIDQLQAIKQVHELSEPSSRGPISIGNMQLSWLPLNHPGGAVAYRFQAEERSVVIASDHEHVGTLDQALVDFARDADLLYLDGQYTDEEYDGRCGIAGSSAQSRHGWGHSTVNACLRTGVAAKVRRLHIGHHDPCRPDEQIQELESHAQATLAAQTDLKRPAEVRFAREGETIEI